MKDKKRAMMKAIIRRIKLLCKVNKSTSGTITLYELSKKSNVPQSTLSTITTGQNDDIRLSIIYKLCNAQGVTLSEFFRDIEDEI